jgi:hypothetical protein
MDFKVYSISGYAEAILAVRMSTSKYYSWEKAQEIRDLVYVLTTAEGSLADYGEYMAKLSAKNYEFPSEPVKGRISGDYETDVTEFKRLLEITFNNAMQEHKHHTLMKYIDISFLTHDLHRGGQDDLDSHALAFQNRITRESTRLANIQEQRTSEWYEGKIIPFGEAHDLIGAILPETINLDAGTYKLTPFGYVLERYADMAHESGLRKDVVRGLMNLATPSNGLWKINLFDLRHVYRSRSKIGTHANPELKDGMEQLAEQLKEKLIVFGEHFADEFTSTGKWTHMNKIRTLTKEELAEFKKLRRMFATFNESEDSEQL